MISKLAFKGNSNFGISRKGKDQLTSFFRGMVLDFCTKVRYLCTYSCMFTVCKYSEATHAQYYFVDCGEPETQGGKSVVARWRGEK